MKTNLNTTNRLALAVLASIVIGSPSQLLAEISLAESRAKKAELAKQIKGEQQKNAVFQTVFKGLTDLGMSPADAAKDALAVAEAKPAAPVSGAKENLQRLAAPDTTGEGGKPAEEKPSGKATAEPATPTGDKFFAGTNIDYPRTFFHVGIAGVNPYNVDTTGALDRSKIETRPFIEFIFNHRWAWRTDEASEAGLTPDDWRFERYLRSGSSNGDVIDPGSMLDKAFTKGWDIQTRFGYTFTGGGSNTPTASTLGSGEFHVEGVLGRTFARYVSLDRSLRMSSGPELSGGLTTEHKDFAVHPHLLAGWGWTAGGKSPLTDNPNHRFAYTVRAGYAWLDTPALDRSGSTLSLKRDATGQVEYDRMKGGLGVETELFYPLSKSAFLTAGGRVYALRGNDAWSFYIGYVQNIDKLLGGLFP